HTRLETCARIRIRAQRSPSRIDLRQRRIQLCSGPELSRTCIALQLTNTRTAVGKQDVDRYRRAERQNRREPELARQLKHSRESESMPLIVRRWTILAPQVVRVDRPIRERNLIVVGVVERARQRVRRSKLRVCCKALLDTQQQAVVLRAHARLEVLHEVRSTDDRIKRYRTDNTTDNEVCTDVAHVIGAKGKVFAQLALNSDIDLVDHRVLKIIVDDVDAARSSARQNESGERICQRGSARRNHAVDRIEKKLRWNEEKITGANLHRQRAT